MQNTNVSAPEGELRAFRDEEVKFVEATWPISSEQAGEGAVGQEFSAGLAGGAVVGLVRGVADALDLSTAAGAGKFEAAVDGHAFAESSHIFGEYSRRFGAEAIGPACE